MPYSRIVKQWSRGSNPGPSDVTAHKPERPEGLLLAPLVTPERYGTTEGQWSGGGGGRCP